MECRFCKKTFSKGEHLRRHERSHTGSRPFVCKDCNRAFARQDSLMRHRRLHTSKECQYVPSPASAITPPFTDNDNSLSSSDLNYPPSNHPGSVEEPSDNCWEEQHSMAGTTSANEDPSPASADFADFELDYELIWPDAEDLFQTIMSSDAANQWQMPLGILPFPSAPNSMGRVTAGGINTFHDRGGSIENIPLGGSNRAVHDVSKMVTSLSSRVTAAVEATSITSVFLDECLHMFFVRFIPTFPILHRATFVFRECTHPLLLNAIAIGSLYLGPKDTIAKGEALWRLAHIAVATSWETLITHRGPYDACKGVQLVVAALLGQVYGALSKDRGIRTSSQTFHALGFFWARHCGMFDSDPYSLESLPSLTASEAEKDHQWRTWVARELQQRALLGHYVIDGLMARMFERPTSVYHAANQLGHPSCEAAFEANTADEWLAHMRSQVSQHSSFRSIISSLFVRTDGVGAVDKTMTAFSLRVVLEGLQSLVSSCDNDEAPTVGVPTKQDVRRSLARFHDNITSSSNMTNSEMLETSLRWHAVCMDSFVDVIKLCKQFCSRYSITQDVWAGGHKFRADIDLVKWASTKDARRALLHAIAIQDIVEQLPRGRAHVIHMPSSLFAASTVYSVFSLAGLATVNLPRVVDWKDVLADEGCHSPPINPLMHVVSSETRRFISGEYPAMFATSGASRNLLYELNSMQKLFRCLSSQWGISKDMEDVMDQWIALCH